MDNLKILTSPARVVMLVHDVRTAGRIAKECARLRGDPSRSLWTDENEEYEGVYESLYVKP